jgi:pimeloyl-ACP methyl ester carboxylesterase
MSTFVLVHGAWHGGWCWERLVPALAKQGHESITMDLPVDDASATFEDYARVVVDASAGAGDDVVVVGHSLGSMVIPLVAAARPVSSLVFLCGVIPNFEGMPWDGAPRMDEPGSFDAAVRAEDGTMTWPSVEAATNAFYDDCSPEDAAWAFSRLRPQRSGGLWDGPYPLKEWPPGRRVAIVGADDKVVTLEFSRYACANRLGVDPVVLPGSHSPFLARPDALADALIGIL